MPRPDRIDVLGIGFDPLSISRAIDQVIAWSTDPAEPARTVVKPYVEFLDRAAREPELIRLLNRADLVLADGIAPVWAAHYLSQGPQRVMRFAQTLAAIIILPSRLRRPLPERIAGINFTWPLLQQAAARQLKVALVGQMTPEAIRHTAQTARQRIAGLEVVAAVSGRDPHSRAGQVTDAWTSELARLLQATKADLVLVGMGFPLQEQVMEALKPQLKHGVLIGEGGTFDYEIFGGQRSKAPRAIQRAGLEWAWRLLLEPSRWRRQLAVPRFIGRVWRQRRP